jgi:DNA repair protein RecN (Recombination protein N)
MLKHLLIRNYALIEQLELSPNIALNIITGETGAGKSIMLGAIGLLLGQRADGKVVAGNTDKCIVEATFDITGYNLEPFFTEQDLDFAEETIVRREISAAGKSRIFINDIPTTLEIAKALGGFLIDIHSQQDTMQLGTGNYQLQLLDTYAGNFAEKATYLSAYQQYKEAENKLNELKSIAKRDRKELDFNLFQLAELQQAALKANEQETLEQELSLLENGEEIKSKLSELVLLFDEGEFPIIPQLKIGTQLLQKLGNFQPLFQELAQRAESSLIELRDIYDELSNAAEKTDVDANQLITVQERLSLIYNLQKKHGLGTINELLALQADLEQKVGSLQNLDEAIEIAQKQVLKTEKELAKQAAKLSATRVEAASNFTKAILPLFTEVGMPNASINFEVTEAKATANGANTVQILFSANKGVTLKDLKQVASGGEFSRLMLCIKYLMASKTQLPTIIFDEIDTGISGEVARKVSKLISQMSNHHQVIAITHLPQLASRMGNHYFVFKDNSGVKTISKIRLLEKQERIDELAQMISGTPITPTAIAAAEEMLES